MSSKISRGNIFHQAFQQKMSSLSGGTDEELLQAYADAAEFGNDFMHLALRSMPRVPDALVESLLTNAVVMTASRDEMVFSFLRGNESKPIAALCANRNLTDAQLDAILRGANITPGTLKSIWSAKAWEVSGLDSSLTGQRNIFRSLVCHGRLTKTHPLIQRLVSSFQHWPLPEERDREDENGEDLFLVSLQWNGHSEASLLDLWESSELRFRTAPAGLAGLAAPQLTPKLFGTFLEKTASNFETGKDDDYVKKAWDNAAFSSRWKTGDTEVVVDLQKSFPGSRAGMLSRLLRLTAPSTWPGPAYRQSVAFALWEKSHADFLTWAILTAPVELWQGIPVSAWAPVLAEPNLAREWRLRVIGFLGRVYGEQKISSRSEHPEEEATKTQKDMNQQYRDSPRKVPVVEVHAIELPDGVPPAASSSIARLRPKSQDSKRSNGNTRRRIR